MAKISGHTHKNNLEGNAKGASIETLTTTWSRFDFGIHWFGSSGGVTGTMPQVHLVSDFEFIGGLEQGMSEVSVQWTAGTNAGTIKETFYGPYDIDSGSPPTATVTRDNVFPGYGAIKIQDTDSPDAGLPGPRYTFMLSGTEYRIYVDYLPGLGQKPICVIPTASTGFPFPLTLFMQSRASFVIRNVTASGSILPSTIYSKREQIMDFGAAQDSLFLRIFQQSKYSAVGQGLPLDVLVVAPALLMEDTTELFTETSDTILR